MVSELLIMASVGGFGCMGSLLALRFDCKLVITQSNRSKSTVAAGAFSWLRSMSQTCFNTLWRLLPSLGSTWRQVDNIFRGSVSPVRLQLCEGGLFCQHFCLVELEYRLVLLATAANVFVMLPQLWTKWPDFGVYQPVTKLRGFDSSMD
jgi:hypothetical protein